MWFKKKEKCHFHEWRLSDYKTHVTLCDDIEKRYELTCVKCFKTRSVDAYDLGQMKKLGLVKGE